MRITSVARPSGTAVDLAIAAAVGLVLLVSEVLFAGTSGAPMRAVSLAALVAGAASLAVGTRWPMVTAVVVAVATPGYYMFGTVDSWTGWLAYAVGVFRLAATGHRASAVTGTAVAMVIFVVGEAVVFEPVRLLMVLAWALVVLSAGEIARSRRAYLRAVEQRAAEAERTREEEARRRATDERLRIAREVHDVLAHNISLINVQASAAAHRRDPEQAYAALEAIKQASRETLRELRSTLGVLRQADQETPALGATAPPDPGGSTEPAPSLDRLAELAERTTAAGLPVRVTVDGEPVPLPASVDAAGYRIVQEALTNAVRHANARTAEVLVGYGRDDHGDGVVTVRVTDDGRGVADGAQARGNGLRGMRERATAVGGSLDAGPRPEGGFGVRAVLPVRGRARPTIE